MALTRQMLFLYNFAIWLYYLIIRIGSVFSSKASLWINGRRRLFPELQAGLNKRSKSHTVWFHCASLGEFEQARPVIEAFSAGYGNHFYILLSFFSPSGYEVRKQYAYADLVCYMPLDTSTNARRFIDLVSPDMAFFVKYEFWYHHLAVLKEKNIPVYLFSALFRPDQWFFKSYGSVARTMLRFYKIIWVQNDGSAELLARIGISAIKAGDTRFDRVLENASKPEHIQQIALFKGENRLLVVGSSWPEDLKVILPVLIKNQGENGWKVLLAPHEVNESNVKSLQDLLPAGSLRFTHHPDEEQLRNADFLILDTIGLLSSAYRYADMAYVGGGFGKGIHNILEAAVYGIPVITGPEMERFREALDMRKLGCLFVIKNSRQFEEVINNSRKIIQTAGPIAARYVKENGGATGQIMRYLEETIKE